MSGKLFGNRSSPRSNRGSVESFNLPSPSATVMVPTPFASQRPLLSEAAFVLEEDDDLLVQMLGCDLGNLFGNLFLKAA